MFTKIKGRDLAAGMIVTWDHNEFDRGDVDNVAWNVINYVSWVSAGTANVQYRTLQGSFAKFNTVISVANIFVMRDDFDNFDV